MGNHECIWWCYLFQLSQQILDLYLSCQQQDDDLEKKELCRAQLQRDIQRLFPCKLKWVHILAKLVISSVYSIHSFIHLFIFLNAVSRIYLAGSSLNGFGSRSSDADLCLVIQEGSVSFVFFFFFSVLKLFC